MSQGDTLSLAFISGQTEATLVRVDSSQSSDYLSLRLVGSIIPHKLIITNHGNRSGSIWLTTNMCSQLGGHIFISYNLGTQDITIGDTSQKFNDGNYHVIRSSLPL